MTSSDSWKHVADRRGRSRQAPGLFHEIVELNCFKNREVDLIAPIAPALKKKAKFRLKIVRLFGERAACRQFAERSNRIDDLVEPPLGIRKAAAFADLLCDCVKVRQRLGRSMPRFIAARVSARSRRSSRTW